MIYFILSIITAIYDPRLGMVNTSSSNTNKLYGTIDECSQVKELIQTRENETAVCVPVRVRD